MSDLPADSHVDLPADLATEPDRQPQPKPRAKPQLTPDLAADPDPGPTPKADPERAAADLLAAAHAFLPDVADPLPVAGRGHLLRVRAEGGEWTVRRLPVDVLPERIAATHALLRWLSDADVVVAPVLRQLPDGATVLARDGARYEVRSWLPGKTPARAAVAYPHPDRWLEMPGALSEEAFAAIVGALARLHAASAAAPARELPRLPAAPLAGLPTAVQAAWQDALRRLRPVAPRTPVAQRWIVAAERAVPAAEAALAAAPLAASPVVAHLDLWPGHVVLDDDGGFAGLLGWDRAALGSPLLDLAQAAVRLRGWSASTAEETISAQGTVRPLAADERRALPALATLDAVAVAGGLLVAAYAPPPGSPAAPSALRQAAGRAVEGLENALAAMGVVEAKSQRSNSRSGSARRRKVAAGPRSRRR
jgi:Ser/Thr protein kinase RdoA (MazF antagonist)